VAVPGWVRTLEDYWLWLERLIDQSGGYLENDVLHVRPIGLSDESSQWTGLEVPKQRVRFHDGTFLDATLVIDQDFVPAEYNFHFARDDGVLIWRKDKHEGHDKQHGRLEHLHLESEEKDPEAFREVDLAEVLDEIRAWQDRGEMPTP
jgi:hypothetical protein